MVTIDSSSAAGPPSSREPMARFVASARAAWPEIALDADVFARHVVARVGEGSPSPATLGRLHGADLYLACACAMGISTAVAAFERVYVARLDAHVGRVARTDQARDEVRQIVREALLIGRPGRPPTIAAYSGRGPLGAWVRVSAVRAAVRLVRSTQATEGSGDVLALRAPGADPEMELLKRRYAAELREAFVATLASLSFDERNVLRLHYLDGLTLEEVGATYRVSRATAARWLLHARERILAETRSRLKARLGVQDPELDSLMALAASRLPTSLHGHLT